MAYILKKRVDYKAGLLFAVFTIPGSILGVYTTSVIPISAFSVGFGITVLAIAAFLFIRGGEETGTVGRPPRKGWVSRCLTDAHGTRFQYAYDRRSGIIVSLFVGYFSPLLGIGGGIIHVPFMTGVLHFPAHVATATSHFILSIMATISVVVHFANGAYRSPEVIKVVASLGAGAMVGAQVGAVLSQKIHGRFIIKALAIALFLVGVRLLISA
ncbi:sulfite exporter TauE/SafE family protein [Parapedobacter sp. ISTM3]|uniref:sulfite exporter TauE/SafE family protein n=1 Tax=Parapedobacter sp. ISTM3 TaxID=2800130 RepID=UPI001904B9E9|nr:sulfite exporter TauE/SafE family protein [Parapedobacter sp. ISTM3]